MNETWKCKCGMIWSKWDTECSRCGYRKHDQDRKFPNNYDPDLLPKTTRDFVLTSVSEGGNKDGRK